jgi:hypothetical protein
MIRTGEIEVLGEEPLPVRLYRPQIPYRLTWNGAWWSTVRGLSAVVTEMCGFPQLLQGHSVTALSNSDHESFLSHSFQFALRDHPTVRLCKAEVSDVACK